MWCGGGCGIGSAGVIEGEVELSFGRRSGSASTRVKRWRTGAGVIGCLWIGSEGIAGGVFSLVVCGRGSGREDEVD